MAYAFDTERAMGELEDRVGPGVARTIRNIGKEATADIAIAKAELMDVVGAAKADIAIAKAELMVVGAAKTQPTAEIEVVTEKISGLETNLETKITSAREGLSQEISGLETNFETKITSAREGLSQEISGLETKITLALMKWVSGLVALATVIIIASITGIFALLNHGAEGTIAQPISDMKDTTAQLSEDVRTLSEVVRALIEERRSSEPDD